MTIRRILIEKLYLLIPVRPVILYKQGIHRNRYLMHSDFLFDDCLASDISLTSINMISCAEAGISPYGRF